MLTHCLLMDSVHASTYTPQSDGPGVAGGATKASPIASHPVFRIGRPLRATSAERERVLGQVAPSRRDHVRIRQGGCEAKRPFLALPLAHFDGPHRAQREHACAGDSGTVIDSRRTREQLSTPWPPRPGSCSAVALFASSGGRKFTSGRLLDDRRVAWETEANGRAAGSKHRVVCVEHLRRGRHVARGD
jgi:hypothetical protein